jgi:hypothetical protein
MDPHSPVAMALPANSEVAGRHNADLEASTLRVIEGGTWKRQDMIVLIPSGKLIPAKAVLSWMNIVYPPNNGVVRFMTQGLEVGEAYSTAIANVLSHPDLCNFKWLLTIETDNLPPPDGVLKLMKRLDERPDLAALSGLYWTKGEMGAPQIWGDVKDPVQNFRPQPPVPGEVVECWGIGMGFALWRLEMFKDPKLRQPWFKTVAGLEGIGTQDLYFWGDARKHGYRCAVDCDVLVGHLDVKSDIVW